MSTILATPIDHLEELHGADFEPATSAEVDVLARVLSAISLNSSLTDALMSFHGDLCEEEALMRSALVLRRMEQILPGEIAERLRESSGYMKPWDQGTGGARIEGNSFAGRFAISALCLASIAIFALSIVGCVATYHRVASSSLPVAALALIHIFR